eukprot:621260-Lingulodinium_polyedra.AAC.1
MSTGCLLRKHTSCSSGSLARAESTATSRTLRWMNKHVGRTSTSSTLTPTTSATPTARSPRTA